MRILIADDEYLVRSSLRSMLDELDLSLDFVGEATNGEEMITMVGKHFPDVAFVDIRMPMLNGLEAIRYGKKVSPHTRWYILTGFPEFKYAQEAIRLGVAGYLLKPVKSEELQRILGEIDEGIRKRKEVQNKQFEHELMTLNYGLTSLEFDKSESLLLRAHFVGAIFCFDSYLPENNKAEQQSALCYEIQESINRCLDNHNRIALFVLPSGELTTVGAWEPNRNDRPELCIQEYFKAVERVLRKSRNTDLVVSLLVSKRCRTYQDLQSSLERLRELSSLRVVSGIGRRLDFALLNLQAENKILLQLSDLVLNLCLFFQEGNYLNYLKALQDLERYLSKSNIAGMHLLIDNILDFLRYAINFPLATEQDRVRWIVQLQLHGEQLLKGLTRDVTLTPDIIDQVTSFIEKNYMLDIGIGQLAERFNITPNYLSTLFHRKVGTNFMSYLRLIRMIKAKELLTDPNIQVQQVAEQVGYLNTRHFARLFTEQFGCLPSEYRDRYKDH